MRKILFFSTWLIISGCLFAQTGNRDSIKKLLLNYKEDTSRVIDLTNLSYEYLESKSDTAMALALEALSLANRIGFIKGKAASLTMMGNFYVVTDNFAKAMEMHLQALQINEKINNLEGEGVNFNSIGVMYRGQEDYRVALDNFFNAKSIAERVNNRYLLSRSLINIGQCYIGLKIFDSASLYILQAYNVSNSINYSRITGAALRAMGNMDLETNQNVLALEHYRLSFYHLKKL